LKRNFTRLDGLLDLLAEAVAGELTQEIRDHGGKENPRTGQGNAGFQEQDSADSTRFPGEP
jgi:hypothetical protein